MRECSGYVSRSTCSVRGAARGRYVRSDVQPLGWFALWLCARVLCRASQQPQILRRIGVAQPEIGRRSSMRSLPKAATPESKYLSWSSQSRRRILPRPSNVESSKFSPSFYSPIGRGRIDLPPPSLRFRPSLLLRTFLDLRVNLFVPNQWYECRGISPASTH
jgi:hypothetical protein